MDIGILIPFFAIGGGLMIPISAIWLKHRERLEKMRIESTARVSAEKAAQYAASNKELEDRVRVLRSLAGGVSYGSR